MEGRMTTEQEKTLEALKTAIQMEVDGKKYYQQMSQTSSNQLGGNLFQNLAQEEDLHRRKFEEIYAALAAKKSRPKVGLTLDGGQHLRSIFAVAIAQSASVNQGAQADLDAVQAAVTMEGRTYDFYQARGMQAGFDIEKQYYQALAVQEREHHLILLDYYEYLKNPAGWFTMTERHSLDGG
jgi:rubrerythrin